MSSETQVYEAQILQQLIKNAERIAVVEQKLTLMEGQIGELRTEMSDIKKELQAEMSEMKTELKNEISELTIKADRAEWWLRFIAGAVFLSFFKEQLMSFF